MDFIKYITENALVLIPVLYIIGQVIKGIEKVADKYIPLILLPVGILGSISLSGVSADSVIQGILVVGVTVYSNQLIKQVNKAE
jgi:hypothetical protein